MEREISDLVGAFERGHLTRRDLIRSLSVLFVGSAPQTRVSPPANKYTPAQDVEMGLQAASEVRQRRPMAA